LFLYTDGVIEAADRHGVLFGAAGLEASLANAVDRDLNGIKRDIVDALHSHTGEPFVHDDVTLMVLEVAA
jgi:serine phosphatase RsbU (regulator of sigma subunit)